MSGRPFIKVHDSIEDHPKIAPLTDGAFRALVTGWGWCHRQNTDGKMPAALWAKRATAKVRKELEAAGLVVLNGADVCFHDYLAEQQSAEERAAAIEQRRSAGRAGGLARAERLAKRAASESLSENSSETQAEKSREEKKTPSVSPRKRGTPVPDLFPITPELAAWGRENAPLVPDGRAETARFLDYHRAKGTLSRDWTAAWRNWMRKANEYATAEQRPASTGNPATAWAREQG